MAAKCVQGYGIVRSRLSGWDRELEENKSMKRVRDLTGRWKEMKGRRKCAGNIMAGQVFVWIDMSGGIEVSV